MNSELIGMLARPRSAADRFRWQMTCLGAAASGVAMLMAAAIAGISGTVDASGQSLSTGAEGSGVVELAPFLAQAGLRPGATLAAALLVVPFFALTLQALRVGRLAQERRRSLLALAGATSGDLRRLAAAETGTAFGYGGLLAGPLYLLAWLLLGLALPPGMRLLPPLTVWLPAAWVGVLVVLAAVGAVLGLYDSSRTKVSPLGITSRSPGRPRIITAVLAGIVALVLVPILFSADLPDVADPFVFGAIVLLVFFAAARFVTAKMMNTSGSARAHDQAVEVLAAAQRRGDPRSAGRVAAVLFVCGVSFGFEAALTIEVSLSRDLEDVLFYVGGALLAAAVGVVAVVVALVTMALSVTDQLLGARRSVASVSALGADSGRLVAVQARVLATAAVPATVAGTAIGSLPGAAMSDGSVMLTLTIVGVVLGSAILLGVLIAGACRLVASLLAHRVQAAADLDHLRTP